MKPVRSTSTICLFGLEVVERYPFDGFTLIYMANAETGFELELTVNEGQSEPYDLGNGYGHLAVSVDDIDAEHQRLTALGLPVGKLVSMEHDGAPFARFFFIAGPGWLQNRGSAARRSFSVMSDPLLTQAKLFQHEIGPRLDIGFRHDCKLVAEARIKG